MLSQEKPQDFELIELLIRETAGVSQPGPSTSTQQKSDFESFKARFQSYIDQVSSYLHSVGKEGFFPHFFLGSFSILPDTQIAERLGVKKVYFRFDTAKTLRVVVVKNSRIKSDVDAIEGIELFSISEDGNSGHQFTSGELEYILKENLHPDTQQKIGTARGIKDRIKGRVKSKLVQINKNEENIFVETQDKEILDSAISHNFYEIKKEEEIWKDQNDNTKSKPEDYIAELTNSDASKVEESSKKVIDRISKVHSKYKGSFTYADQAREAAHHGFIAGALVNFRYRHNLRVYLEQFAGRGYADIVLVPRGKDRSLNAVPIIIELKAGTAAGTTPGSALDQAKDYAKGFQPNTMRVLTVSDNVLCVGLNLDSTEKFSMYISPPADRKPARPTIQKLLEVTSSWSGEESAIADLKKEIKQPLERIYHTFPGTPEKGGNYFSRFLLGQLLLANEFKRVDLKRFIFLYDEYPLDSTTKSGKPVTTFTLIRGGRNEEVFIFHVREGGRGDRSSKKILMPDSLTEQSKITEVYISLSEQKKSDFFNIEEVNRYDSLSEYKKRKDFFKGKLKEVPYLNGLREAFDEAFKSQITPAAGKVLSVDKYDSLTRKVGEGMFSFKDFIGEEAHFQGVLHGAFSYYSDLKLKESPRALILTEFQTGRGKRIDMVVHGISTDKDGNAKEYDPVGLELKGPREGKTADALKDEANKQITDEYTKGVTYKTLTDGKEVDFVGVVFDKEASDGKSLILMSKDEFASVKVVHSSIFSFSQQQCSKGRRTRSIGMPCIDSFDKEKITDEEKEQRIKELFNADKVAERVKNIEFYDQLFKVSQKISEGEIIDKNVEEAFVAKIKDIDLDSIDPEIRDIVKEMKDNIENKEEVKNILRRSGIAERIGKVAEGAGLAFTVFLVGKHIANGDIEGLGYDALNLWVMPKIGEKISGKMLELGTKLDSQMLKRFAPVMGRAIGNFVAFLGLAELIKARQSATDPADIKIADLNIATNSIFTAADVPAVVTETMSVAGLETGVVGEFAGPVGAVVSVAVIVISQFVEAGLEVEKLGEHIKLTDQEKHDLYWDFFLGKKVPDYIENDMEAESIYKQYVLKLISQYKDNYDKIVMSLPYILVTKERRGDAEIQLFGAYCHTNTKIVDTKFDFGFNTNVTYPFHISDINSRVIPTNIESYSVVCGPRDSDVKVQVDNPPCTDCVVNGIGSGCDNLYDHSNVLLNRTFEKWFLQEYPSDCYNSVIYRNTNSRRYGSMYHIPSQNANINVVFQEKDILNGDRDRRDKVENRYYFEKSLDSCKVHNPGSNFFYITGKFSCDLGADGQKNVVITQGNLTTDSINIHSIIGSNKANHIKVSYADYVDGKGGNDVITVKNFTTIKGYFGDSIYGKGLVLLPINFNDVGNITHVNNITNIYNKSGAFISVDKQTSVKTADGLFVTPTKIDDKTGVVTNLHVTKSLRGDVVLDDELDNLRKIDNSNFNITKQLSSANYHSTIGSSSNHIFYPDKEHHNFYWEAPSNISHLYLFDNRNANITIAQANGILDFSQLNCTLDDMPLIEDNEGEIKINRNGLNVTLLPNYKDVTVTFNGEEYYKLQNGELERDYCSHSLRIDGRFSVNGTDLLNHHNCFTFDSDKVLFLKLNNDLLLLSDKGALSISDYYSSVHKNWDLSIELNNRIMEPEEFGERADDFSSFRYYKPDEQGLQIYHNQPINKNDIGLVDLKDKSILDFDMKVMDDTLLLSHKNNTLVKIENWNIYQPAREMMLAFNDAIVSNSKCIVSTCKSEDIVVEFNREKEQTQLDKELSDAVQSNSFSKVKSLVSRGANINAKDNGGNTLLHNAARENRLDAVKCLIGNGANINVKNNRNLTPLQVVGSNSNIERVLRQAHLDRELLLTVKSEEDLKTINGLIAKGINGSKDRHGIYYFAWRGDLSTVKFIVEMEGGVNVTDKYGCTLLHWAALKGHLEFAKFLVNEKKANVNAKDILGRTPMHFAVMNDYLDLVELLISAEANIDARDNNGQTPLCVAVQYNRLGIVNFWLGRSDLNDNTVLKLAYCIKGVMEKTNNNVSPGLEKLKNKLPESVKNAVFSSAVCIKNVEYGRYLYSPNNDCMYHLNNCDRDRRYVFTWPSNGRGGKFKWKIEPNGDNVYLKNVKYGRYLYSPNNNCMYHLNNCDSNRRYAFTWPSNGKGGQFKWKIEPNGDNVYLKNVEYGRYLYSPNNDKMYRFDSGRRYVFTWPSNGKGGQFKWKIEDCGSTRNRRSIQESNGYNQTIVDYQSILTEENSQQVASRISTIVEDVERHTFLNQSKNQLDLDSYLNNRERSNAADFMRRDICSKLNTSERRNIVLGGNDVCAITSGHETLDIENLPIPEVTIYDDFNKKESLRDTLDLRQLVQQINSNLSIELISKVTKDKNDLLIKLSISATGLQQDVATVRLKDAFVNNWYKELQIILNNAPMKIDDNLDLSPLPLTFDEEIVVVTSKDVEGKDKLIISKEAGQLTFLHSEYDLMITNAFNADVETNKLCTICLKDFYREPKMETLSIKFTDKEILLSDEMDKINNADSISDKLNINDYISSIVKLQESSAPLEAAIDNRPIRHRRHKDHSRQEDDAHHIRHKHHRVQKHNSNYQDSHYYIDQPEIAASGSTRPSSWINDLFSWVKSSISRLLDSRPSTTTKSPISQVDAPIDINGTIILLDLLIRKVTGQKYISTIDQSISPLEAQEYTLNITKGFEKVVEQAGLKSGVSMHRLNIDYMGMQKEITRKVMSGKFDEVSGVLSSYIEKACPSREAGKLSPKKFDKFMIEFNKGLDITLNQSIQQILNNRNSTLEVNDVKEQQISLEPQSYLSNASVHSHSKVSTCLSDVGVTKLGNTLSK